MRCFGFVAGLHVELVMDFMCIKYTMMLAAHSCEVNDCNCASEQSYYAKIKWCKALPMTVETRKTKIEMMQRQSVKQKNKCGSASVKER